MGKIKQPKISQGKNFIAKTSSAGSTNQLKPVFSFEYLVDSYSVNSCTHNDKAALAVQLSKIGCLQWGEIQNSPRHGLGHEIISHDSFNVPLPKRVTPDVTLLAFRFSGKKPMIGFRSDQIFYILFLDHNFSCYDHG